MATSEFEKLQEKVSKVSNDEELYSQICTNIKKFRLEKYNAFKASNPSRTLNPYSSENMAALIEYNHTHYKRFESANDSTKKIPLTKLRKIAVVLDKTVDDFMNK